MPTFVPNKTVTTTSNVGQFVPDKASQPKKKGKKRKGVTGFFKNAAGDVVDITTGIVPGVVATGKAVAQDVTDAVVPQSPWEKRRSPKNRPFTRTGKIVKAVGKSYSDMYGPLLEGDWKTFLDNVYKDPVYVALDAATVASLGLKGAVTIRPSMSKAGRVIELTGANGEKIVTKTLSRGELRAQLQAAAAKMGSKEIATPSGRVIRPAGMTAAKTVRNRLAHKTANTKAESYAFDKALSRLKGRPDRIAVALKARFDRPALNAYMEHLRGVGTPQAKATLKLISNPKVQRAFDNPSAKAGKVLTEARNLGRVQENILGVTTGESRRFRPAQMAEGARWDPKLKEFTGGPSIEDLKARGLDPVYLPDTSKGQVLGDYTQRGGGKGVPRLPGETKQNKGSLLLSGQLLMDPGVLNRSFLNAARFQHYSDTHEALKGMSRPADYLEEGFTYVRRNKREKMSPQDASRAEFEDWAKANLDEMGDWQSDDAGLVTKDPKDAEVTPDGKYLVVPDKVAKVLTGEYSRQSAFFRWMNRYPLRVWRAMVLGLRPAYLVNNMVGNTLMYIVHSGRPEDLKQLALAFKQFAKPSDGKQIDRLLEKHFAGQVHGGFVATQFPEFASQSRASRAAVAVAKALPAIDKRWEQALRRGKVKAELKRHPQLRAHAERMGGETSYFEKIAGELDNNPDIVTAVYERVNDALGSYDNLTRFEKNVLRNAFPFYAWFRAITGVTTKLAVEQPVKMNLLARLGQVAIDQMLQESGLERDEIPPSLVGFLYGRKDGNRMRGINTAPLNPYGTVGQLADFAVSPLDGAGAPGKALPGFNPLIQAAMSFAYGREPGGYSTPEIPGIGVVTGLPWARLASAAEGKYGVDIPGIKPPPDGDTFNDRDFIDEFLRYLGVPYARVSPSAAKRVAER